MFLYKKAAGGGGVGGGTITGELIGTATRSTLLPQAPQAGDLIIAHRGSYAFATSFVSGVTQVASHVGGAWSGSYQETSGIGYRIATGTEGTNYTPSTGNFDSRSVIALYRFSQPVTSVITHYSSVQTQVATRTVSLTPYSTPHIVIGSQGAYQSSTSGYTVKANATINPDYRVIDQTFLTAAAFLNTDELSYSTANWSSGSVSFNEANTYAILGLNF